MDRKEIPVGVENFKDLMDYNYYFVDKSLLLRDLMHRFGKVTLFTRPRRFGKTLNMSMIRYFFEKSEEDNAYLFEGLQIAQAGEEYLKHQGQYPVISITLKDIERADYNATFHAFKNLIASEFDRHSAVLDSPKLKSRKKVRFENIYHDTASDNEYEDALKLLSECLYEVYEKKVIILIDEYDVPLQNAYFKGFYDQMVGLIRSVFSNALKTNNALAFGVLTGCLRISKESIFTGLNNLDVYAVTDTKFADVYGFTEDEVRAMTDDYALADRFDEIKEWYDGYLFGGAEIYNPWSVLKYVQRFSEGNPIAAEAYWVNTSSNSIIQELIEKSNQETRDTIEELVNGGSIKKRLFSDITYANMDVNQEHIWSFLLYTGYLKSVQMTKTGKYIFFEGMIPNLEVATIYEETFQQWFDQAIRAADKSHFFNAVLNGESQVFEAELNNWLLRSISYHDRHENFYHGFLTGLLEFSDRYLIESNRENGTGRSDIIITDLLSKELAVVIETKSTDKESMLDKECQDALNQIHEKKYAANLINKGYKQILKYGIAFCGKNCKVVVEN